MQGRGEWGEGNHHMVRGKDLERKKAYCLYCGKPVSELAVRSSLVDEPEIFRLGYLSGAKRKNKLDGATVT